MGLSLDVVRIALARAAVPIMEHGGRNRGPDVDRYNRQVGLDPARAYAWCTSGLYDAFLEASRLASTACPFPKAAKAVHVWQLLYQRCYEPGPAPGRVYVLDHGKPGDVLTEWKTNRYTDDGHIGIVFATNDTAAPVAVDVPDVIATLLGVPAPGRTFVLEPGGVLEVSANTNAAGSREGDRWAVHHGSPEISHGGVLLGYLDLDRLVQPVA